MTKSEKKALQKLLDSLPPEKRDRVEKISTFAAENNVKITQVIMNFETGDMWVEKDETTPLKRH